MPRSLYSALLLALPGAVLLSFCSRSQPATSGPEGYRLYSAMEFIPRGYSCSRPCRCLEIYSRLELSAEEQKQIERARLNLRGFAGPDQEADVERCDPSQAVARCQIHARDALPEKSEPPDLWLVWYDGAEIGAAAARDDCSAEGFRELQRDGSP